LVYTCHYEYDDLSGTAAALTERARTFVAEGWAGNFNELLAEALQRYLESHSAAMTEDFVMSDVQWGLRGNE
jgi:hypothetical protein